MKAFIEPSDVLFFRDARTFNRGDDHIARLIFPPLPMPFYGAIRSSIIAENWKNFKEFAGGASTGASNAVGSSSKLGTMSISHFSLASKKGTIVERLYPIPGDLVEIKGGNGAKFLVLSPRKIPAGTKTNLPSPVDTCVLGHGSVGLEEARGFLNTQGLSKYLEGKEITEDDIVKEDEVFRREYRVGIARSKETGVAREGMLYSAEFARLNKSHRGQASSIGFLLEINGEDGLLKPRNDKPRILRLGGETRTAYLETEFSEAPAPVSTSKVPRFKSTLLTPAVFTNGWIPDGIDAISGEGILNGHRVRLVSAAVNRHVPVGGWDIAARRSKTTKRAVPQGSVYYFELLDSTTIETPQFYFPLCRDEYYSKQGFGLSIIGDWNYV